MEKKSLSLVPFDQIPVDVVDTPLEDLTGLYRTCLRMHALCDAEGEIGLSAVQVGVPWRLYVVRYTQEDDRVPYFYRNFVNCEYAPSSEERIKSLEGCLSIRKPDGALRHFELQRYREVEVSGHELSLEDWSVSLAPVRFRVSSLMGIVHQHEIDHHRLITIDQIGREMEIWR